MANSLPGQPRAGIDYPRTLNRRTSKARGLLFYRLVTQAVRMPHVDTDTLFRATGRGRRPRGEANHERWGSEEGSE